MKLWGSIYLWLVYSDSLFDKIYFKWVRKIVVFD